ncbi:MAG TPA: DUF87 domain-containing protein [Reyranella sp.]|nr:DUF87 domain-containing protein [Reyranella sp.]
MTTSLKLARELSLPLDAVTQTLAAIGRKGAGKTYLAQLLAEQMLDAGAQVIVIDPVGNWWSLRVAADGKGKGKDIFVLGGEHGDVPLTPESGAKVARFLVEKRVSAVLDLSPFREGERKRFAAAFAEEFFHLKKTQRSAVHLVVEESQKFIPQRTGPDEARMLGAFENIIRLGRNYGVGATLVTQRPQSVNKEVLSQVECLCVLQVNGTHERKALDEWVQEAGADRKLVGELPGLAQAEGYVWSPSWLRIFQRVHFAKKTTFDASATPEVGKAAKAATLAKVDVEALRTDLAEVVKTAEQDDPKALRRRIAELERDVRQKAAAASPAPLSVKPDIREVPMLTAEERAAVEQLSAHLESNTAVARQLVADNAESVSRFESAFARLLKPPVILAGNFSRETHRVPPQTRAAIRKTAIPMARKASLGGVSGVEQRILDALAELEALGSENPEKELVALLAGYSNLASKGFANAISGLKTAGAITYPAPGVVALTDHGRDNANAVAAPRSTQELQARLLAVLGGASEKILRPIIEAYPDSLEKTTVAAAAGYGNLASKGFANAVSRLRTLGFIDYPSTGRVVAKPVLFLEARR